AVGGLHTNLDDAAMLLVCHGRHLAGGADWHEAMGACGDLPVDESREGFLVQRPIGKRGNERRDRSSQHSCNCPVVSLGASGPMARKTGLYGPPAPPWKGHDWRTIGALGQRHKHAAAATGPSGNEMF